MIYDTFLSARSLEKHEGRDYMLNICSGGVAEEHPDNCSEKTHFRNLIYLFLMHLSICVTISLLPYCFVTVLERHCAIDPPL